MPIYKYECKTCGHIFEDLRGFNDPNPEACPKCEAAQIERLISGGNFHLKGSGWYVTDYGGTSNGKASSETSTSDDASSGSTTSGSTTSEGDSAAKSGSSNQGSSDGTEAA